MPLILTRRAGQKIVIRLAPDADPQACLHALQADGIEITVHGINDSGTQARLLVEAPRELLILREELTERDPT